MPHGTLRFGDIEITALCDLEDAKAPLGEVFDTAAPPVDTASLPERYPDDFTTDAWRFRDHCFLIRTPSGVALVDTGVGPTESAFGRWLGVGGRLPDELESVGVAPADIDHVLISHVHSDHIGWNTIGRGDVATPRFPSARYHIHPADWSWVKTFSEEEDLREFEDVLAPLERSGQLSLEPEDRELLPGLRFLHAPGHTPGHRCTLVSAGGERVLVAGDLLHFSFQIGMPEWGSSLDADKEEGSRTRVSLLDRVESEGMVLATAHLPSPFCRLAREDGGRVLRPLPPG